MNLGNIGKSIGNLIDGKLDLNKLNLEEILTDQFIQNNTTLDSVKSFLDQSGFNISSLLDLKNIPLSKLDTYIKSISSFGSWKDFLLKAAGSKVKRVF